MMSRVLLAVAVCALLAAVSTAVSSESPLHHQHHVTAHKHHTPLHPSSALAVKKSLDTLARDVSRLLEEEVTFIDNLRELAGEDFPLRPLDLHHVCDAVGDWLMDDFEDHDPRLFSSHDDTRDREINVNLDELALNTAYQIGFKVQWTLEQINTAANALLEEAARNAFLDTFSKRDDEDQVIMPREIDPGFYEIHNFVVVRTGAGYFLLQGALGHFSLKQWLSEDQDLQDDVVNAAGAQSTIRNSGAATAHTAFGRGASLSLANLKAGMAAILNAQTEPARKLATLNTFGFDDAYNHFVTYKPEHTCAFFRLGTANVHADSQ